LDDYQREIIDITGPGVRILSELHEAPAEVLTKAEVIEKSDRERVEQQIQKSIILTNPSIVFSIVRIIAAVANPKLLKFLRIYLGDFFLSLRCSKIWRCLQKLQGGHRLADDLGAGAKSDPEPDMGRTRM